jgi:hypothetical protein
LVPAVWIEHTTYRLQDCSKGVSARPASLQKNAKKPLKLLVISGYEPPCNDLHRDGMITRFC